MANNFKIVISATDKATSSVRKVNDAISKMTRPFSNVQRSAAALGKEIARNPVAKSLKRIGRVAEATAASVAKIAVPMAGLVGFGSIAGLTMLVTEWGRLGFEIGKTAGIIGLSTSDLQSLRGAAELAGVSSAELTSGMKSLGDTMQDALYGRNQSAMMMLSRIGVQIHHTASGAVDTARALRDVAGVLALPQFRNPQVQGLITRTLGIEALLPLLRKGRDGIAELERKVYEFGGVKSNAAIEASRRFGESMLQLKAATSGLKVEIGSALLPVLDPLVRRFRDIISANREAIGAKIGEWVKRLGDWIGSLKEEDFDRFAKNMETIGRAIAFVGDRVIDLIAKFEKLKGINPAKYILGGFPRMAYDWLTRNDKQPGSRSSSGTIMPAPDAAAPDGTQAAPRGIRNNNPGNLRKWGNAPVSGGYAVFRSPGEGIRAMASQLALYGRRGTDSIGQIISRWAPRGENDTGSYISDVSRQTGFAPNAHLNLGDPQVLAPLVSAMIRHENGQNPYSKSQINDAVQHVVVEFKNAPPGTTATAKTAAGKVVPVRISHSLPTLAAG